jgi:CRISPR-associated protein Csh1
MGFIQAVYDLGLMIKGSPKDVNSFDDISSYLQLPMPIITDEKKSGREIRVWLSVEDKEADVLKVLTVSKVDLYEYPHGDKEKYLFREPVSSAANWRFSPVYKLGKGTSSGLTELIGKGSELARSEMMDWLLGVRSGFSSKALKKEIKDNRYFKLKNSLLNAFEEEEVFTSGTVNIIMHYLIDNIEKILELWMDTNRSYVLIFGIEDNGRFLYPGEVSGFRRYFEKRITTHIAGNRLTNKEIKFNCAICNETTKNVITVNKLFAYATFDKANFLPGSKDIRGAKEKVYPVCKNCFTFISEGKEKIKDSFRDSQTVPGINIDVVPELIFGSFSLKKLSDKTEEFLRKGIKTEEKRFNKIAEQGDGLVYHFSFWEQNQRQERIHLLIEDVPPSRLKKILKLWQDTIKIHLHDNENLTDKGSIDSLFKLLYRVLINLAGKREEDKRNMRDKWINMTGKLLGGEYVDVFWLKTLIVSRFPGLFADHDWVIKFSRSEVKNMIILIDFFEGINVR